MLRDPNGMWGRMETSIRLSMENELKKHFTLSLRKIPMAKTHRWTGSYDQAVLDAYHELKTPVVVTQDVLGPDQRRFSVDPNDDEDVQMMTGTVEPEGAEDLEVHSLMQVCPQCDSGSIIANCDCSASTAFRSFRTSMLRKRPTRASWESTIDTTMEFLYSQEAKN